MKRVWALATIGLLCFSLVSVAQTTNASISGTVLDPMNAVVAGAQITAVNVRTGVMATTTSNGAGVYTFPSLQPGVYKLTAESSGFQMFVLNDVNLEIGARLTINFSLVIGAATSTVDVAVNEDPLLSTSPSVDGVINDQRVQDLPLPNRDALGLVVTQPGVSGSNMAGSRIGAVNVTRDGVNVSDPFINTGVGSVLFNSVDVVQEVRVVTSPVDAELGRGSGQVQMATRYGTNNFHGSIFEFNRNTALTANNWFNNLRGDPRNTLILNQFGGRIGGPVKRDKSFFHFTYEGIRQITANSITALTYTPLARQGIFRFYPGVQNANANASVPTVDLLGNPVKPLGATGDLQAINLFGRDPNRTGIDRTGTIPRLLGFMPTPNDYRFGDGLNVAGYTWRSRATDDLNQFNGRFDHHFNTRHQATVSYAYVRQHLENDFMPRPFPTSPAGSSKINGNFVSLRISSTLSSTRLNEFFAGTQRVHGRFYAPWELPGGREVLPTANGYGYLPVFRLASDPIPTDNDPQGRISPLYLYGDTFHMQHGKHDMKFGGEMRFVSSNGFSSIDVMPRVTFGLGSSTDFIGVNSFSIPGLGANEGTAQSLVEDLSGSVGSILQAFNSSGGSDPKFLAGVGQQRTYKNREFSLFVQDDFKFRPNLNITLGMRYEFYGVPYEAQGRMASLVGGSTGLFGISGHSWSDLYHPGRYNGDYTQVQLVGKNSPNPQTKMYPDDLNNFGPAVGFSWSVPYFGREKTVLRGGYSIKYEREPFVLLTVVSDLQPGLRTETFISPGGFVDLSQLSLPLQPQNDPLQIVPLTDRIQPVFSFDNNLQSPYIQNWNLSLQRRMPADFTLDVRYVGSKGTKLLRMVNINEINIFENGLLDAFLVTQQGGNAPLFDRLFRGFNLGLGTINGSTVTGSASMRAFAGTRSYLANNNIGFLGSYLNLQSIFNNGDLLRFAGLPENFFVVNPQFGGAFLMSNFSNSTYHSLQINADRRISKGFALESNYTWSRTLGDEEGESQTLLNSYRNARDRRIDKRLLAFHRTHIARTNGTWELPFGPDRKFLSHTHGVLAQFVAGWKLNGIFNVFSGTPLGLGSGTTSFNQLTDNTATQVGVIPKSLGEVKKIANGVVYFDGIKQIPDPSIANLTALQILNSASVLKAITDSSGNLLAVNPKAGTLGTMSQTYLEGPGAFRFDMNVIKSFKLRGGKDLEFRADAIGLLNHPFFVNPITDINSVDFGRITQSYGERIIALSARFNF